MGVAVEACGLCGGSGRVPLDWDGPMPSDLVALAGLVTCPDCSGTGELPVERMNTMTLQEYEITVTHACGHSDELLATSETEQQIRAYEGTVPCLTCEYRDQLLAALEAGDVVAAQEAGIQWVQLVVSATDDRRESFVRWTSDRRIHSGA